MLASFDTETGDRTPTGFKPELNFNKFVCGFYKDENGKEFYCDNKQDFSSYILKLAEKEAKRKHCIYLYAHNAKFDFLTTFDRKDPKWTIVSESPFIAKYKVHNRYSLYVIDLMNFYKMALKELGLIIGLEKYSMDAKSEQEMIAYVKRDTEIVFKAITELKDFLNRNKIYPKRLLTIHQVAINFLMKEFEQFIGSHMLFSSKNKLSLRKPFCNSEIDFAKLILKAYRSGRNECQNVGTFEHVNVVDCNKLYSYAAYNLEFPDLRTERKYRQPLKVFKIEELEMFTGVANIMIKNVSDEHGFFLVRQHGRNIVPRIGSTIIGTYTIPEIMYAIKNGYELIDMEWVIVYEKSFDNPLKQFIQKLTCKISGTHHNHEKYFYKQLMNSAYGKLAQHHEKRTYFIDNIENTQSNVEKGHLPTESVSESEYMFIKAEEQEHKNYFCPIIPILINAHARIYMHINYKKIKIKDFLYTDNDSIFFINNHINTFEIGTDIGQFKVLHQDKVLELVGNKTYRIENQITMAGVSKRDLTTEAFEKGIIHTKRMKDLKDSDLEVGTGFVEVVKSLSELKEKTQNNIETIKERKIYIDDDERDVNYYINIINQTIELNILKEI